MDISESLADLRATAIAEEPAEKADMVRAMARTQRELQERGSDRADGRGQMMGSIPARLWFRWNSMLPGCWRNKQFTQEFFADNPQLCAVGYRPPAKPIITNCSSMFFEYHRNKHKVK